MDEYKQTSRPKGCLGEFNNATGNSAGKAPHANGTRIVDFLLGLPSAPACERRCRFGG